jgi:hypothetical protein
MKGKNVLEQEAGTGFYLQRNWKSARSMERKRDDRITSAAGLGATTRSDSSRPQEQEGDVTVAVIPSPLWSKDFFSTCARLWDA